MDTLSGNTQGLSPADKKALERIWRRRVDPSLIVTPELAGYLCECAHLIQRQVGVLIDRRGDILHVIVGDQDKLMLPDLGPRRAGQSRFRGVRLIHTHLRGEPLTRDDLLDLAKLHLDLVAAIQMTPRGALGPIDVAHLLPENPQGQQWHKLDPIPPHALQKNEVPSFLELIRSLEEEFAAKAAQTRAVHDRRERAVLVQVQIGRQRDDAQTRLHELKELCRTAGVRVLDVVTQRRPQPDPKTLVGKGKLEDIVLRALQADATLLIIDHDLTPAQARTIGDLTELKVLDRTMLILDIFAQHAHSRDGKLQVELAQLKYTLPRLHEKNTMMSRLTGGIGGRGPGETKLEINRRRAKEKLHLLEQQIKELAKRRGERRSRRTKSELPIVAIVGYTNAGKSTLLNTLTQGEVLAEDKLFATLDPTSRRLRFPSEREIILTDTVGFIRDLPKDLVAAFRATLEELDEADLLLHVVDASDPAHTQHIAAVDKILGELALADKQRLLVFNKIDRMTPEAVSSVMLEARLDARREPLAICAQEARTLGPLFLAMERALWDERRLKDRASFEPDPDATPETTGDAPPDEAGAPSDDVTSSGSP
jgi:GTP-binding protein HflX